MSLIVVKYFLKKFGKVEEGNILLGNICVGIETFCNQSGSDGPKNVSFRIIDISLRFIAIFSVNSYAAVIISFLTARFPENPFSNLNEFLKLNEYRLLTDAAQLELIRLASLRVCLFYAKKKLISVAFLICINILTTLGVVLHTSLR